MINHESPFFLGAFRKEHERELAQAILSDWPVAKQQIAYLDTAMRLLLGWKVSSEAMLAFLIYTAGGASERVPAGVRNLVADLARILGEREDQTTEREKLHQKLKALFIACYEQIELAYLALAGHIACVDQDNVMDKPAFARLKREYDAIFLPLLELLGCWGQRHELIERMERLSVLFDKRGERSLNREKAQKAFTEQQLYYQYISAALEGDMQKQHIQGAVHLHKSLMQGSSRSRLRDSAPKNKKPNNLMRLDVIVDTVENCYQALGLIHQRWTPLGHRISEGVYPFKDLIASPKYNGYRSLVTTVRHPMVNNEQKLIEFRIRTEKMELVNMYGVIAADGEIIKNVWWRKSLAPEPNLIKVFSPNGEFHSLPKGSVLLDFAYQIHSNLGDYCKNSFINGSPAPLEAELQDRDLVWIQTDADFRPNYQRWLSQVKTPYAKSQIKQAISRTSRTHHQGYKIIKKILDDELTAYCLNAFSTEETEKFIDEALAHYKYSNHYDFYLDIANSHLSAQVIVRDYIAQLLLKYVRRLDGQPIRKIRFMHHERERVCFDARIVGRLRHSEKKAETLCVYCSEWPEAPVGDEAVALAWAEKIKVRKPVRVVIQTVDRSRILGAILQEIYQLYNEAEHSDPFRINLLKVNAEVQRDGLANIDLLVNCGDDAQVDGLHQSMSELKRQRIIDSFKITGLSLIDSNFMVRRKNLPNPYNTSRPCERRVFKGREPEIQTIFEKLSDGQFIVLWGVPKIGKTSLLTQIRKHIAEQYGFIPVFLDSPSIEVKTEGVFWRRIGEMIEKQTAGIFGKDNAWPTPPQRHLENSFDEFCAYLERLKRRIRGRKILLIIDEFSVILQSWETRITEKLIQQLKHFTENQDCALSFIFCIHYQLMSSHLKHPPVSSQLLSRFFSRGYSIKLGKLDSDAAAALIRDPLRGLVEFEDQVVTDLIRLTAGHPFYLQKLLSALIDIIKDHTPKTVTPEIFQLGLAEIFRDGLHVFFELLNRFKDETDDQLHKQVFKILAAQETPLTCDQVRRGLSGPEQEAPRPLSEINRLLRLFCDNDIVQEERRPVAADTGYRIVMPLFRDWLKREVFY